MIPALAAGIIPQPSTPLEHLQSLAWNEEQTFDSVTFHSGESFVPEIGHLVNRVSFIEKPGFDIWLLRQRRNEKGYKFTDWSHFAIVMDKGRSTAHYFKFIAGPKTSGEPLIPAEVEVSCAMCHASGPRALRPVDRLPLAAEEIANIKAWNERIASYKIVTDRFPKSSLAAHQARFAGSHWQETLALPVCHQCHNPTSGIRNHLKRLHSQAINYLIDHSLSEDGYSVANSGSGSHMPIDSRLSNAERECLTLWTSNRSLPADCHLSSDNQESDLVVTAKTNLHDVEITGITVKGEAFCNKDLCQARGQVDLTHINSGIRLRDLVIKKLLPKHIDFVTGAQQISDNFRNQNSFNIEVYDQTIQVDAACQTLERILKCDVQPFTVSFEDLNIAVSPPFGIVVQDTLTVRGSISLNYGRLDDQTR
jgi:hypothetical protein